MDKINLANSVYETAGSDMSNLSKRSDTLIRYFIKRDIEEVFGKIELDKDEIEIAYDGNQIIIRSIFNNNTYFINYYTHDDIKEIECYNVSKGRFEFKIQVGLNVAFNEVIGIKDNEEKTYKYSVDYDNEEFAYTRSNESKAIEFDGILKNIGAKVGNTETFDLDVKVPKMPKEKSILKRIYDNVVNGNYVSVVTEEQLCDVILYSDIIFNSFIEKVDSVLKKYEKTLEKNKA